jgi:hypothetical protein
LNKFRKNIISLLLSLVIFSGGNFAFAISHFDCTTSNDIHLKCEMECCQQSDCCKQDPASAVSPEILSDNDGCCVIHIEEASAQNLVLPVIKLNSDKNKIYLNVSVLPAEMLLGKTFIPVTQKFKTSNIYLTVSNLRI